MMQGTQGRNAGVSTPKALKRVYKRLPQVVEKLEKMGFGFFTMTLGQGLMELDSEAHRVAQGLKPDWPGRNVTLMRSAW